MDNLVVVTGATSGIGLAAAEELARQGNPLALVGRDPVRLAAAADRVRDIAGDRPDTFQADFARLDDVRALAAQLRDAYPRIPVLANNAGGMFFAPATTIDGFEITMQTNHLAPFLLTALLRDRVDRVVITASAASRFGTLDPKDLNAALTGFRPMRAYGCSKLANIMFTAEAAHRWPDVLTTCFHPGLVRTGFGATNPVVKLGMRILPMRSAAGGADTLVWLASQPRDRLANGGYYTDRKVRRPRRAATDRAAAASLWETSAAAVGL